MSEHAKPLQPGEIRTHTVGGRTFQVMHIMNGGMTQASVREDGQPSRVICTDRFDSVAVRAYAEAIEQAEADYADADREDDAPEPLTAEGEEALCVRAGFDAPSHVIDSVRALTSGASVVMRPTTSPAQHTQMLGRALRATSAPAPTLADDVAALRSEVEAYWRDGQMPNYMTTLFDRIAGAVPQRATDADELLWLHPCGHVQASPLPVYCPRGDEGAWRALYTLGGQ